MSAAIPEGNETFWCWLADVLPRRLVYWCATRVISEGRCLYPSEETKPMTPSWCLHNFYNLTYPESK